MTIEYFNSSGQKVAELKNFASKSVRDAKAFQPEKEIDQLQEERVVKETSVSHEAGRKYNAFERLLRQLLAEQLEKPAEQMDIHAGYYELGLDSPSLLEIVQAIGSHVGEDLSHFAV